MNTQALQQPRIEQATITVQHIFPSKGPGKSSWIKDTDGTMFGFWPDKISDVRQGETYEIEFTANVKNGTTYRDLKSARVAARPSPAPAQFTASQPRSLSSAAAEQPRAVSPNGNRSGEYFRPTSPKDARRMFICSQMNALITSHQVQVSAQGIAEAIVMLSDAYDATLGRED